MNFSYNFCIETCELGCQCSQKSSYDSHQTHITEAVLKSEVQPDFIFVFEKNVKTFLKNCFLRCDIFRRYINDRPYSIATFFGKYCFY